MIGCQKAGVQWWMCASWFRCLIMFSFSFSFLLAFILLWFWFYENMVSFSDRDFFRLRRDEKNVQAIQLAGWEKCAGHSTRGFNITYGSHLFPVKITYWTQSGKSERTDSRWKETSRRAGLKTFVDGVNEQQIYSKLLTYWSQPGKCEKLIHLEEKRRPGSKAWSE